MPETINTLTTLGLGLAISVPVVCLILIVLAFYRYGLRTAGEIREDRGIKSPRAYERHTHIILATTIVIFVTGLALFLTLGRGDFVPVYTLKSSETILPTQSGESLGSPYLTVNERQDRASFTVRDSNGALDNHTAALTANAASQGLFDTGPVTVIIDDADAGTARYEIESCTLNSDDSGPGAGPNHSTCTERRTLHIPTISTPAQHSPE